MGRCVFASSDRLIKITQTESGTVPVMTFLQCHAPCFQINYNVLCTADMSFGRCASEFTIERPIN